MFFHHAVLLFWLSNFNNQENKCNLQGFPHIFQFFLRISRDFSEYSKFIGIYREVGTLYTKTLKRIDK